jgi:hypothetical protein
MDGLVVLLLAERARSEGARSTRAIEDQPGCPPKRWVNELGRVGWEGGLLISRARATRGLRRPSPGLMARLGVPAGGRVRKLRAVEGQSAPIPERSRASLEGAILGAEWWTCTCPCFGDKCLKGVWISAGGCSRLARDRLLRLPCDVVEACVSRLTHIAAKHNDDARIKNSYPGRDS